MPSAGASPEVTPGTWVLDFLVSKTMGNRSWALKLCRLCKVFCYSSLS